MSVESNGVTVSRFAFAVPHDVYAATLEDDELALHLSEHKESREHKEHKEHTHREPKKATPVSQVRLAMKGMYPD